jgi:hypothetical protein
MRKGKPGAEGSAHQSHPMFFGRNGIASRTYKSLRQAFIWVDIQNSTGSSLFSPLTFDLMGITYNL